VVIGPSGCGKTTTLNLIAGLMTPDGGRIALGDRVLWDGGAGVDVPAEKRKVGYVFQDFALFPHMTVAENLAYGLKSRKRANAQVQARVGEALKLLGIEHLRDRRPGALSGGERQRVALGRAVACEAELLLLDEPLGSLDAQTRNHVRGELRRLLQVVGRIAIMVTHDYVDALTFGDCICVMDRGRVVQLGDRRELLRHPKSRFVADLTGVNFFEGTISSSRQQGLAEIWVGETCLYAACDHEEMGDTLVTFFPSDVTLSREPLPSSARNVFRCRVQEIIHMGDKVRVALNGVLPMCAEVTAGSLEGLGIGEGDTVFASVKATAVKIYR
jgi:molybdenum ABC transporter ATP-binding protein